MIDDKFAGKRARCKRCGNIMSIPASDQPSDLVLMEDTEPTGGYDAGGDAPNPWDQPEGSAPLTQHSGGITSSPGRQWRPQDVVVEREGEVEELALSAPFPTHHRPGRRTGPTLDWLVPLTILAFIGGLVACGFAVQNALREHYPPEQWELIKGMATAYTWGYVGFALLGLFVLAGPITLAAIAGGAHIRKVLLPGSAYARACAVAAVPALVIVLIEMSRANKMFDEPVANLLLLASIPLSFLVLRFVFGFDWQTAGISFGIAMVIGGVAVFLSNNLARKASESVFLKGNESKLTATAKERQRQRAAAAAGANNAAATAPPSAPGDVTEPGSTSPPPPPTASNNVAAGPSGPTTPDGGAEAARVTEANLRQLGSALNAYYATNNFRWPADLNAALSTGMIESATLKSPFGPSAAGTDYAYTPGPPKSAGAADLVLAYDRAEFDKNGRATVLFADMSIRSLDRAGVEEALAKSQQAAARYGAPGGPGTAAVGRGPQGPGRGPGGVNPLPPGAADADIRKNETAAAFGTRVRAAGDKLLAGLDVIPLDSTVVAVVRPATPSAALAVVRSNQLEDTVDVWSDPAKKSGTLTFKVEPALRPSYALSPDGQRLVRVTSFPKLAAKVVSVADGRELSSVDLNSTFGTPTTLALLPTERIVVRWERNGVFGLEAIDLRTRKSVRTIDLPEHNPAPGNEAFSPDGRFFATGTRQRVRGELVNQVVMHAFADAVQPKRLPVEGIDPRWSIEPAGIAFTPDGAKVAALFAKDGNGLVISWNAKTGKPLSKAGVVVPGVVNPLQPITQVGGHRPFGGAPLARSLSWLGAGGTAWLVAGSQVIDATDGRQIGDLAAGGNAFDQTSGADNVVYLPFKDVTGPAGLAVLKLDPKALPAGVAAGPSAAATQPKR
jgi:hypothetical protein